jgi:3-oxoacyl-[acyl-carrier-protein] synthase-3
MQAFARYYGGRDSGHSHRLRAYLRREPKLAPRCGMASAVANMAAFVEPLATPRRTVCRRTVLAYCAISIRLVCRLTMCGMAAHFSCEAKRNPGNKVVHLPTVDEFPLDQHSPLNGSTKILGTGHALPAGPVDAATLDAQLALGPGTTLSRNGIRRRGFASSEETASALGAAALARALETAGIGIDCLDALLFAGVMSEQPMPPTSVAILRRLGGREAPTVCFDINASCLGFLRGMEIAGDAIASGRWCHVAIVAADLPSKGLNWSDPDTATLFGDGAGAAVLGPAGSGEASRIAGSRTLTLTDGFALAEIRAGGSRYNVRTPPPEPDDYLFRMDGRGLLRAMQQHFPGFLDSCLALAGGKVDVVVPHQASAVGLKYLRRLLQERGEPALADILASHGNQVAASLPTALDHAIRGGMLQRGNTALLIGTAAGVTMGGLVLRY